VKLSLPIKLGIFVVLVFSVVIAVCLLWTPVRIKWYEQKMKTGSSIERQEAIIWLVRHSVYSSFKVSMFFFEMDEKRLRNELGDPDSIDLISDDPSEDSRTLAIGFSKTEQDPNKPEVRPVGLSSGIWKYEKIKFHVVNGKVKAIDSGKSILFVPGYSPSKILPREKK
jgi:hypothetical protein